MLDYRLMTISDYEAAYDLWIRCGNGLNDKDDSREGIDKYLKRNPNTSYVAVLDGKVAGVSSADDGGADDEIRAFAKVLFDALL